ncbi:TPA_asm: helix-turn-helix domain-containing protein [Listeria monocytogenes]|uniref:Helix-turn-helix domain-containing protein n=1 Tax=Listeria monocytogenes TaxID=1639 RepID=A0A3T2FHD3_LISMN|nr:helix-turn-helix transcriptional regulator [Listeria monocytogenes]EAE3758244.1 XRE family transcriptional regulator [Listeria monocytogenes serotype 1/2b]EKE4544855.1 helix-turn-helix transcriptional regulator [Listeria monocytogenes serotype 1/2a]AVV08963.1 XRE family transcriptional regulator [Listeria monocytogenes]EAA0306305.1 XRE family transcriptional regulator [Listeria monocytogenes]EAA0327009.1 XRE family transcriptional regulator [Listeria monocytogenes]
MITKLKELRIENNLTYGDVATKVGISKEYYWMIENGERDGYTYNTAKKIASVFDKNPDDIFLR